MISEYYNHGEKINDRIVKGMQSYFEYRLKNNVNDSLKLEQD